MMFIGDAIALKALGPEGFKEYRAKQKAEYLRSLEALKAFAPGVWHPADTHPGTYARCFVSRGKDVSVSYGKICGQWQNEYGNGPLYDFAPDPDRPGYTKYLDPAVTHWMRYPELPGAADHMEGRA